MKDVLQVVLTRGGRPECIHRTDVAILQNDGTLKASWGNPEYQTYWRSGAKPFQVLPLLLAGGQSAYNLNLKDIAVMSASHSGEPIHVEQVRSILKRIGCTEEDLECGTMAPLNRRVAKAMVANGEAYGSIHNTCSGKHASMLALARILGVETKGYSAPEHPVQQLMLRTIAEATETPLEDVHIGVDGCGVPVFWLSLSGMAKAYAKLADPDQIGLSGDWVDALKCIRDAMASEPLLVAGTGRIEATLMAKTKGRVIAKSGTDGIFCLAHPESKQGLVLKVEDGAPRALNPAVLALCQELGWITQEEYQELWALHIRPLVNHRGDVIGDTEVVLK